MTSIVFKDDLPYTWSKLSIFTLIQESTPSGWKELFEILEPYLEEIAPRLLKIGNKAVMYPDITHVFRAFYVCPLSNLKVIIIGQDPYHNGAANGMAFSIRKGQCKNKSQLNSSLQNIFKKLKMEGYTDNETGDLFKWAREGVLLLNTAFTVIKGCANVHKNIWKDFTNTVIAYLSEHTRSGLVWILWGAQAKKYERFINLTKHNVIGGVHPSGLSAHKGFFDREYFREANKLLQKEGIEPVDWNLS